MTKEVRTSETLPATFFLQTIQLLRERSSVPPDGRTQQHSTVFVQWFERPSRRKGVEYFSHLTPRHRPSPSRDLLCSLYTLNTFYSLLKFGNTMPSMLFSLRYVSHRCCSYEGFQSDATTGCTI
jgi:hypothetical protein